MYPVIVAVSAKRLSGKTTLTEYAETVSKFRRYSFATRLRQLYSERYGISMEELLANKEKFRPLLIEYSWIMKQQSRYYFADAMMDCIRLEEYVMIDDLRFFEELQRVQENNGFKLRLVCSNQARALRGWEFKPGVDDEASETEMDAVPLGLWNAVIDTSGDLGQSKRHLFKVLSSAFPSAIDL